MMRVRHTYSLFEMTIAVAFVAFMGMGVFALMVGLFGGHDHRARQVLERQGFTDIHMTGYRIFGCAEDDVVRRGFVATALNGERVTGVVCSGVFVKSSTIRLD